MAPEHIHRDSRTFPLPHKGSHTSTLAPPAYSKLPTTSTSHINAHTLFRIPEDEEVGFCNYHPPHYPDENEEKGDGDCCCWGFADGFALALYVGMIVMMVLNLDFFLSRLGVGTGVFASSAASHQGTEVVFCRTYLGSGQSTYRLLSSGSKACVGESISLFTFESKKSAFSISDGVLFSSGSDTLITGKYTEKKVEKEKGGKFLNDENVDGKQARGPVDVSVQEGKLSRPLPSLPTVPIQEGSMHVRSRRPQTLRL